MTEVVVTLKFDSVDEMIRVLDNPAIRERASVAPARAEPEPAPQPEPEEKPKKRRRSTKKAKQEETAPEPKEEAEEEAKEADPEAQVEETTPDEKKPGYQDARAALLKVNSKCGPAKVKEILGRFGCQRITEVQEDSYAEFVNACEEAVA